MTLWVHWIDFVSWCSFIVSINVECLSSWKTYWIFISQLCFRVNTPVNLHIIYGLLRLRRENFVSCFNNRSCYSFNFLFMSDEYLFLWITIRLKKIFCLKYFCRIITIVRNIFNFNIDWLKVKFTYFIRWLKNKLSIV